MPKSEGSNAPKRWAKPSLRRITGGSAELNSSSNVDGSGTFS